MNHELYMTLYGHCWNELKQWIGSPANEYARMFAERLAGGCPTGAMKNDMDKAHMLFQDRTLTPRQRDAVRLLAVISNHRPIAWRRESKTPDGKPPLAPLTKEESLALWRKTREATSLFTSHLPKREGAALMAVIDGATTLGTPSNIGDHTPQHVQSHFVKSTLRDEADVLIDSALTAIHPKNEVADVWCQLQVMASAQPKVGTLIAVDRTGVQYLKNGEHATLTRDALRSRLKRRATS